jgi:hypothetical protein
VRLPPDSGATVYIGKWSWFGTVVVPQVAPHACVGSSLFECLAAGHSVEFVPLTNQEQRWMLGLRLRTAVRLTKAPKTRAKKISFQVIIRRVWFSPYSAMQNITLGTR